MMVKAMMKTFNDIYGMHGGDVAHLHMLTFVLYYMFCFTFVLHVLYFNLTTRILMFYILLLFIM